MHLQTVSAPSNFGIAGSTAAPTFGPAVTSTNSSVNVTITAQIIAITAMERATHEAASSFSGERVQYSKSVNAFRMLIAQKVPSKSFVSSLDRFIK